MPSYSAPAELEQTHFQIYLDDAGLNDATPIAAVDTTAMVELGQRFRCRIQVATVDLGWSGRLLLEYRINQGAWAAVDTDQPVRMVDSPGFVDGEATTSRLGSAGLTFAPGEGIDTRRNSNQLSIGFEQYTEVEWNLTTVGLTTGDLIEFRVVAMSSAWAGGQTYTASELATYDYFGAVIISAQSGSGGGQTYMMYEAYTEIGWGIEAPTAFAKFVPASQRINAIARLPEMAPAKIPFGGFRGVDAPVDMAMGTMPSQGFTLSMEATPDQIGKALASLFGDPSTTGAGPYTHNFLAGNPPRTLTLWQKEHFASDESGNPPLYRGYGGCILTALALEADANAGGILQASFDGLAAAHIVHNSATSTGMNSAFGAARPFLIDQAVLMLRDTTGTTPSWNGEIQSIRLRFARGGVAPVFRFAGKAIAQGYRYRQQVHLVELSIQVYRVGLKPLKLVLGQPEVASYPLLPGDTVQKYAPSGTAALSLEFTSTENPQWKFTIETPKFAFVEQSATSGGDEPMTDTFTLQPLVSGTQTLSTIRLINANSTEPGTDGTPLTGIPSGRYSPF